MSTHEAAVTRRRPVGGSRLLDGRSDSWFVPVAGLLVVSVGAWLGVQLTNPDAPIATSLAAAGAAGLAILVAFVLAAPMAMFTTAFALLAFVVVEPAPVDVVFLVMIALTVAARLVDPLIPGAITMLLALYVALTVLSIINAADASEAVRFELITLYLVVLGVWLTWTFRDARATRLAMTAYTLAAAVTAGASAVARFAPVPGGDVLLYDEFRVQGLFQDPNVFAAFLVPAAAHRAGGHRPTAALPLGSRRLGGGLHDARHRHHRRLLTGWVAQPVPRVHDGDPRDDVPARRAAAGVAGRRRDPRDCGRRARPAREHRVARVPPGAHAARVVRQVPVRARSRRRSPR